MTNLLRWPLDISRPRDPVVVDTPNGNELLCVVDTSPVMSVTSPEGHEVALVVDIMGQPDAAVTIAEGGKEWYGYPTYFQ